MKKNILDIFEKISKKFSEFFYKKLRIHLFLILASLFIFSLLLSNEDISPLWDDFWINIAAGLVGSLITIYFVDILINQDRKRKFKSINETNHFSIRTVTERVMANIMIEFGFIDRKRAGELMLSESVSNEFRIFAADKKTKDRIKKLEEFVQENGIFLKKINKILDDGYKSILKMLGEFKPYPDPSIEQEIIKKISPLTGFSTVGVDLIDMFYKKLPKEKMITKQSISQMMPGMKLLWKIFSKGMFRRNGQNYSLFFKENFQFLSNLYIRAEEGTLFWDI